MGDDIMIKVLEILVLGGIGSINGVLFAGLMWALWTPFYR